MMIPVETQTLYAETLERARLATGSPVVRFFKERKAE